MNSWSHCFFQNMNQIIKGILPCTEPHYRAEILTIFGSYFGRNYDFINSFWNLLTFISVSNFIFKISLWRIWRMSKLNMLYQYDWVIKCFLTNGTGIWIFWHFHVLKCFLSPNQTVSRLDNMNHLFSLFCQQKNLAGTGQPGQSFLHRKITKPTMVWCNYPLNKIAVYLPSYLSMYRDAVVGQIS